MPGQLFGICVAGIGGNIYRVGDAGHEFTIMSVAKPFVFALVCQLLGAEQVRHKLGVNATGLAFNSLAFVERSADGRSNPMVNAGAIAATSLVPGDDSAAKWQFIREGLSGFAGRDLALSDEVYASASATNYPATAPSPTCWPAGAGSTPTRPKRSTCTPGRAAC